MNEYLVIGLASLLGSGLTLFSGFGLGTILVPVFALFFPIELSIILTAIVHFLNNLFKLFLLGRKADKNTIIRFGLPSILAAFLGAYLLSTISDTKPLLEYTIMGKAFFISPVKLMIAILMLFFSLAEFIPGIKNLAIDPKYLPLGGLLSGFFGGLSGNQGALRAAFLIRVNLSKESFIATGVVLACLIDVSRLSIYTEKIILNHTQLNYNLILVATLSAFAGVFIGNKVLKKVTLGFVQNTVAIMLLLFSVLLGMGII
jgi:uncharacterized membrane protein YfcA